MSYLKLYKNRRIFAHTCKCAHLFRRADSPGVSRGRKQVLIPKGRESKTKVENKNKWPVRSCCGLHPRHNITVEDCHTHILVNVEKTNHIPHIEWTSLFLPTKARPHIESQCFDRLHNGICIHFRAGHTMLWPLWNATLTLHFHIDKIYSKHKHWQAVNAHL